MKDDYKRFAEYERISQAMIEESNRIYPQSWFWKEISLADIYDWCKKKILNRKDK